MIRLELCSIVLASLSATSCATKVSTPERTTVAFHVVSDPGVPVAGARLMSSGRLLGATDAAGSAHLALSGHEGDALEISTECPADFRSPAEPTHVVLRQIAGDRPAEFETTCAPKTRSIVLAVNAIAGHRLPVIQLGQKIGETDASGAATLLLRLEPHSELNVTLDTSAPEDADLRPRNPTATWGVPNRDDVLLFDPQLTTAPPPPRHAPRPAHRAAPKATPAVPVRIQ